jgi:DNA-binding transcriptional LysR family regulator
MYNLSLPDIRLQMAAVTLAEEFNFSRAAERLRITQPALSKQIVELESRLGFAVFSRNKKRVELTHAGQVFVRGCKDSLAILEKAVRTARATQDEAQPVVTIGHSPYVDPFLVSVLLGIHLPLYPNLRLRMESMFAQDLIHSVLSAELDLAIVEDCLENPLLTRVVISTEPFYALLSIDHPASKQRSVAIEDFRNVGWMMFPRRAGAAIYEKILDTGRRAGVEPMELHHYVAPQEVVQLISMNFGVAFMPKGIAEQLAGPGMVALPFDSKDLRLSSQLVLRADQASRLVNEFGRAFLKKLLPNAQQAEASGQLLLKL